MPGRSVVKRKRDVSERMGKHKISKKGEGGAQRVNGVIGGEGGGLHRGVGGGVNDVPMSCGSVNGRKKKVNSRGVGGVVRTRKPSERILKTKLVKTMYGKNGEGNSTTNPMDID
ncbi:unnamed protein product [Lactuca virosa]|uniref:Uncharacterized protein n=1 Tax=Lactuca virosa TaxID=75947 RepID=A0AAU9ME91_9ASTR|nr:unnamed protein product [Lactuca virosa]